MLTEPTYDVATLQNKVKRAASLLAAVPAVKSAREREQGETGEELGQEEFAERLIWARLSDLGVYDDAQSYALLMSPHCQEGEARRVFCENGDPRVPPVRFKALWSVLKEGVAEEEQTTFSENVVQGLQRALRPVSERSDVELLEQYGRDCPTPVEDELKKRSQGRPCVVFQENDEVNVAVSKRLLQQARRRETKDRYEGKRVFEIGEFPGVLHDECPLHNDELLFEGYCSSCDRNWNGVNKTARVFTRLMVENGYKPVNRMMELHLHQEARKGLQYLREHHSDVALLFDELNEVGELPRLKVRSGRGHRRRDPMQSGKRY